MGGEVFIGQKAAANLTLQIMRLYCSHRQTELGLEDEAAEQHTLPLASMAVGQCCLLSM